MNHRRHLLRTCFGWICNTTVSSFEKCSSFKRVWKKGCTHIYKTCSQCVARKPLCSLKTPKPLTCPPYLAQLQIRRLSTFPRCTSTVELSPALRLNPAGIASASRSSCVATLLWAKARFSQEKGVGRCLWDTQELTLSEFMRKETLGRERTGKDQSLNDSQGPFFCDPWLCLNNQDQPVINSESKKKDFCPQSICEILICDSSFLCWFVPSLRKLT